MSSHTWQVAERSVSYLPKRSDSSTTAVSPLAVLGVESTTERVKRRPRQAVVIDLRTAHRTRSRRRRTETLVDIAALAFVTMAIAFSPLLAWLMFG
jgi:hypothetical protein